MISVQVVDDEMLLLLA